MTDDEVQAVHDLAEKIGNEVLQSFAGAQNGHIMLAVGYALAWFADDSGIPLESVLRHVGDSALAQRMSDPKRHLS